MIPSYNIRLSPRVSVQLEAIFAFIAKDSPANASGFIDQILKTIEALRTFPNGYPKVHSQGVVRPERKVVCGNYIIYFEVDEMRSVVHILRVVHGARRTH